MENSPQDIRGYADIFYSVRPHRYIPQMTEPFHRRCVCMCVCLLLKLMQAEVEQLQEKVNGLHSMVVVVDENNAESGRPPSIAIVQEHPSVRLSVCLSVRL